MSSIVEAFSVQTKLPVLVDNIADWIKEKGYVEQILFGPDSIHDDMKYGYYWETHPRAVYSPPQTAVRIVHEGSLNKCWSRLLATKELMHSMDAVWERSNDKGKVDRMIDDVVTQSLEHALEDSSVHRDRNAIIEALMVLCPIDALEDVFEVYRRGGLSSMEVAEMFEIPEEYARVVLKESWLSYADKYRPR